MLHLFLKCIAIKCDKFISLVPATSSKDVIHCNISKVVAARKPH